MIDKIVEELVEGKDMKELSYAHGVATSQQLLREQLNFVDIDIFAKEVEEYEKGIKEPQDKVEASTKLRAIAEASEGFQKVDESQAKEATSSIASLYYILFINDPSFSKMDLEAYIDGLKKYWKEQKLDNEQELAENYFTYKAHFSKDLGQKYLEKNKERDEVSETESGLQFEVITKGDGETPEATSNVTVHYHGALIDGKVFDSSYDRGEQISFALNQVIPGWTEGLQLMAPGAKYRLYIPYELGYGEQGTQGIPPFSTLIFDVELFSVN